MVKASIPNIEKSTMLLKAQDISRPLNSIDDTIMLFNVRNIILRYNIIIVGISKNGKYYWHYYRKIFRNFYMNMLQIGKD